MSLLLESLKKAALEKQKKEKYSEAPQVSKMPIVKEAASEADERKVEAKVELQAESKDDSVAEKVSDESHDHESKKEPDSEEKPELELEFNIEEVEFLVDANDPPPTIFPDQNDAAEAVINAVPKVEEKVVAVASHQAASFTPESGKAALTALLEKNNKQAKSKKIRSLSLMGILVITGIGILGGYYYFLMDSNSDISSVGSYYLSQGINQSNDNNTIGLAAPDSESNSEVVNSEEVNAVINETDLEKNKPTVSDKNNSPAVQEEIEPQQLASSKTTETEIQPKVELPEKKSVTIKPLVTSQPIESYIQSQPQMQDPIAQQVTAAYNAYQHGNWDQAQTLYHDVLMQNAYNRDALLGAAAVAVRQGKPQEALGYYQQQLERDPQDEYAMSGIMTLSTDGNNTSLMSDIDRRLQEKPGTVHLLFLKGTLLANQQQWVAAQGVFFEAWHYDKNNADLAYNLAVCLDRLNQPKEAIRFYQMALSVKAPNVNFSPASVESRLVKLTGSTP